MTLGGGVMTTRWAAWHDMADAPFLYGTRSEAEAAARDGWAEGDYIESSATGRQYGYAPGIGWVDDDGNHPEDEGI